MVKQQNELKKMSQLKHQKLMLSLEELLHLQAKYSQAQFKDVLNQKISRCKYYQLSVKNQLDTPALQQNIEFLLDLQKKAEKEQIQIMTNKHLIRTIESYKFIKQTILQIGEGHGNFILNCTIESILKTLSN